MCSGSISLVDNNGELRRLEFVSRLSYFLFYVLHIPVDNQATPATYRLYDDTPPNIRLLHLE